MQLLEHYVADGILGRAASGRLQELYKLGVSFLSDDAAVMDSLPEMARERFNGLILMIKGCCTIDLFAKVMAEATLAGPVAEMMLQSRLRYRQVQLRYKQWVDEYGNRGQTTLIGGAALHDWASHPLRMLDYRYACMHACMHACDCMSSHPHRPPVL